MKEKPRLTHNLRPLLVNVSENIPLTTIFVSPETMFGWIIRVKEHPHKDQERFPTRTLDYIYNRRF